MQRPKAKNLGFQAQAGDVLNRGLVLLGDGGHARLDAVDSQRVELLGDGDFLLAAEDDGGLLLAVAQGDVMNLDLRGKVEFFLTSGR